MAKNTSISNDVDFIKEFEELKLKQKLLIDSLNKKNITQQNQLFLEINSKLDFLVKIFKDANDTDSKAEEEKLEKHFKEVLDKIDSIQISVEGRIKSLEENNLAVNKNLDIIKEKVSTMPIQTPTQILTNSNVSIPTPDFKINPVASAPVSAAALSNSTLSVPVKVEEKKKGWFK